MTKEIYRTLITTFVLLAIGVAVIIFSQPKSNQSDQSGPVSPSSPAPEAPKQPAPPIAPKSKQPDQSDQSNPVSPSSPQTPEAPKQPSPPTASQPVTPTGIHWADSSEFKNLKRAGFDFVVTTVSPNDELSWQHTIQAAETAGIKLIIGAYPEPYLLNQTSDEWTISAAGQEFLKFLASHPAAVMAVFVYNEPYWVNPFSGQNSICGALTAAQLRKLRTAIRSIWPEAKIYHDVGQPSAWSPQGWLPKENPCIGHKYADQSNVADYVGIWCYPFNSVGYEKERCLAVLRREVSFIQEHMKPAQPISLNQSYKCSGCSEAELFPTGEQIRDWNCATRTLALGGISWYAWRQGIYEDFLANHLDFLPLLNGQSC